MGSAKVTRFFLAIGKKEQKAQNVVAKSFRAFCGISFPETVAYLTAQR
jgi:hypothetical protein